MPSSHDRTEMNSVVLEIDPVFMYQIGNKLKWCLKASEWDIPNPIWKGKLQIVEVHSNRRQVQFVNSNGIFGVVAIKDHVGSPMFQKVLDSNRYFTTEIRNTISGKNDVIGVGFINRSDSSKLLEALDHYFTLKDDSTAIDVPIKCNEKDQVKVEIKTEVPENSQVEIDTPQESQSAKGTLIRSHRDSCLLTDTTTNILAHTLTGQENRIEANVDEYIVEDHILTSGGELKYKLPESESTIANNSEGETHCSIRKKRKIEPQSQDLMHIDTQPEQKDSQESVKSFHAVQQPSRKCCPNFLHSEAILNNKNGIICLNPVTLELICPFCGFNTHATYDMKLLLSHWQKDGDIENTSTCSLCYIIFSTPEQRLKHIKALHIVCDICSMEFRKQKVYDLHMESVHNCNKQVENDDTSVDEHNVEEGILSNGGENKFEKEDGEITSDDNSEEEAPCIISEKEKIEIRPRDRIKHEIKLLHIDSPSEKNLRQETVDCVHTDQEPSGSCVPSFFTSEGLLHNGNGAFCLDPVTLELICPLCSFKTGSIYDMKLLLSHWRKDHDMTRHDTCRLCFILFSTPEQRLSHLKAYHYVCAICLHEVKLKKEFLCHIKEWHVKQSSWISPAIIDNNHHICNRCSKEFENTNDLIDHFSLTNSATQCSTATTTVQEQETGSAYSLEIGRKNKFICHLCPISKFSSFTLSKLLYHWETEHNLRNPITCKLCHLIFLTKEQRLYHVMPLHEKMCSFCAMEFDARTKLQSHLKERHYPIVNNYYNMKVPAPKSASIQAAHEWRPWRVASITPTVHNTPMPDPREVPETGMPYQCRRTQQFICIFCPLLKFPLKRKLDFLFQHWKEVHFIFERHKCQFCYLIFPTAELRLNHIISRHHVCSICSREFGNLQTLNKHLKRHYISAKFGL